MIVIVDYGVGNLASIRNMLKKVGLEAIVSSDSATVASATKLILPGVGAFDTCAGKLSSSGLQKILDNKVLFEKTPVLGVCVGMQLMTEGSEEGVLPGLGWVKGRMIKFKPERLAGLKVPHMGWTETTLRKPSRLFSEMSDLPRFYFVHSYHADIGDNADVLVTAEYGYEFVAGLEKENIVGVQFHPEKSHKYGMKVLRNFAERY
jgi:glutamine amidotransferase